MRDDTRRWRFGWLLAAPHRIAFAAAATMFGLSAIWWALALLARVQGLALPWTLPAATAHGLVMGFGFMPLFFAGFLFTAGPKWLRLPPVPARELVAPLLAQLAGWCWFLIAVHGPDVRFGRLFGALGLAAVALGWSWIGWRFYRLLRASRVPDRLHARLISVAALIGALALWTASAALAAADDGLIRAATRVGLWAFIGFVYLTVADRMIPFFGGEGLPKLAAWRPAWLLVTLIALFALEAAAAVGDALALALPAPLQALLAAFELAGGLLLLALALRWGLLRNVRIRLLAMLYTGFVWLGLAFVLAGVSHARAAAGAGTLGLAPLHAYTMGFLGSTLIAMVTRVSSGHGGRPVAADDFVWRLFWLLQFAIVARVASAVLEGVAFAAGTALTLAAAFAWAAVCSIWAVRYGGWYGRPRIDGRPG